MLTLLNHFLRVSVMRVKCVQVKVPVGSLAVWVSNNVGLLHYVSVRTVVVILSATGKLRPIFFVCPLQ